jgi:hypothetical protein
VTDASGAHLVRLEAGRYWWVASHPAYVMRESLPDSVEVRETYYREVKVTPELPGISAPVATGRDQTVSMRLSKRSKGVVLVTTSLLERTRALDAAIADYQEALRLNEGMTATLVVVDSTDCLDRYGARVEPPAVPDWNGHQREATAIRDLLQVVTRVERASYVILLGSPMVMPRPSNGIGDERYPTDAFYIDFDNDDLPDPGLAVSRLPDLETASDGVAAALETAAELHGLGGYDLTEETHFSTECWVDLADACLPDDVVCGVCRKAPPFGTCPGCSEREEFLRLVSTNGVLKFEGHGSPTTFADNDRNRYFQVGDLLPAAGSRGVHRADDHRGHPLPHPGGAAGVHRGHGRQASLPHRRRALRADAGGDPRDQRRRSGHHQERGPVPALGRSDPVTPAHRPFPPGRGLAALRRLAGRARGATLAPSATRATSRTSASTRSAMPSTGRK